MRAPLTQPARGELATWRIWVEVLTVILLSVTGLVLGALTGWLPLSPILGVVLPIAGASVMLRVQGSSWRDLGFACPMLISRFVIYTITILVGVFVTTTFLVTPMLESLGVPPPDVSLLQAAVEGNLVNYLIFLVPISWGSAAIGEELIARGFLLDRFMKLYRPWIAVIMQAAIFALAHFYQGLTGVVNIFVLALIFGAGYLRAGRNLWPLIAAHGIIDSVGMTLLYLGRADLVIGAE